jgi:4a-hydroxytetrahydrobiopterin dehydratase
VPEWLVVGGGGYVPYLLSRIFVCRDYKEAIAFIVTLSDIAEAQGHHPDFTLSEYKRLEISLTTHAAKGLTINDFVLATLIDAAWAARKAT